MQYVTQTYSAIVSPINKTCEFKPTCLETAAACLSSEVLSTCSGKGAGLCVTSKPQMTSRLRTNRTKRKNKHATKKDQHKAKRIHRSSNSSNLVMQGLGERNSEPICLQKTFKYNGILSWKYNIQA